MNYNEFISQLKEKLQECLGESVSIEFRQIMKNNDIRRDSFLLSENGTIVSPVIYLENFYYMYKKGVGICEIAGQMQRIYQQCCDGKIPDISRFGDIRYMKERILCKLINRSKNRELLNQIPYVPYLDLAVVFYYMLEESFGNGTMLIYSQHLKLWDISVEDIYCIARSNTRKLLPSRLYRMEEILKEFMGEGETDKIKTDELPMYVITNERKYFGACGILYDSVLKKAADEIGGNFYILPGSIHECILVPEKEVTETDSLEAIVKDINRTKVLPEEILSDRIYHYDSKKHHLTM